MAQAGTLTGTWDETTLEKRDRGKEFTHRAGHTSYTSQMAGNSINDRVLPPIGDVFTAYFRAGTGDPPPGINTKLVHDLESLPPMTKRAIRMSIEYVLGTSYPRVKVWSRASGRRSTRCSFPSP